MSSLVQEVHGCQVTWLVAWLLERGDVVDYCSHLVAGHSSCCPLIHCYQPEAHDCRAPSILRLRLMLFLLVF